MQYYSEPQLEAIRVLVERDIIAGIRVITASYVTRQHKVHFPDVQKVLLDLAMIGDLEIHYRVLCSGENQNYDVDLDVTDIEVIPAGRTTCTVCGDLYIRSNDNISVYFEPTISYLTFLQQAS
jgi:hypothetical protein